MNIKKENGLLIITTNYSYKEEGFGADYLQDEIASFNMNLEKFNLTAEQGKLSVSLIYNNMALTSSETDINIVEQPINKEIKPKRK